MKLIHNRLDYSRPWELPMIYLFTGNPVINSSGDVVMGRGAARQVRDTYPIVPGLLGKHIRMYPKTLLTFVCIAPGQLIGWVKVKHHWADPARLDLVRESFEELSRHVAERPHLNFCCNYPAIGNGHLSFSEVQPVLDSLNLPDNLTLFI